MADANVSEEGDGILDTNIEVEELDPVDFIPNSEEIRPIITSDIDFRESVELQNPANPKDRFNQNNEPKYDIVHPQIVSHSYDVDNMNCCTAFLLCQSPRCPLCHTAL